MFQEGANRVLRSLLLKSDESDRTEWVTGEVIGQLWRPEFDDVILPYLPPHVSRPKENIKLLRVTLPPRCVLACSDRERLEFVSVSDIRSGGPDEYNDVLRSLPLLLSRYVFKELIHSC